MVDGGWLKVESKQVGVEVGRMVGHEEDNDLR